MKRQERKRQQEAEELDTQRVFVAGMIGSLDLGKRSQSVNQFMTIIWLVVWNMAFIFPYIGNI